MRGRAGVSVVTPSPACSQLYIPAYTDRHDPNVWTDEGAVRLNFYHERRGFAENEISACYSLPTGQIASRRSRAIAQIPASFIWLSGFARVEEKDGAGEIIPPVRPMNRRDWEGERKAENRFHGSAGARDRQENLNEAAGRRSRLAFCVRITPYLFDFANVTTVCGELLASPIFAYAGKTSVLRISVANGSGFYHVIRHPSYLGLFVNALGWGLAFRAVVRHRHRPPDAAVPDRAHRRGGALAARDFRRRIRVYRARTWRLFPSSLLRRRARLPRCLPIP